MYQSGRSWSVQVRYHPNMLFSPPIFSCHRYGASILYIFRRTLSMESLLLWMFSDCCYSYHRAVRDVNKAIKLPGVSGSVNVVKDLSRL